MKSVRAHCRIFYATVRLANIEGATRRNLCPRTRLHCLGVAFHFRHEYSSSCSALHLSQATHQEAVGK